MGIKDVHEYHTRSIIVYINVQPFINIFVSFNISNISEISFLTY
jgi:hypothetical protein